MEGQNINTPNHTHSPSLSRIIILLFFAFIIVIISSIVTTYYLSSQLAQQSEPVQNILVPTIIPTINTTTDETVNWKTYTDSKYGFSFRYPQNWLFINDLPGWKKSNFYRILVSSGEFLSNEYETLAVTIDISPKSNVETLINGYKNNSTDWAEAFYKIGNLDGKRATFKTNRRVKGAPKDDVIFALKDDLGLIIYINNKDNSPIPYQILSTFKFTNQTSNEPLKSNIIPDDWKQFTATDPEFGIKTTMSMPSGYSFSFTGSEFTIQNDSDATELWDYSTSVFSGKDGLKNYYDGSSRRIWYQRKLNGEFTIKEEVQKKRGDILNVSEHSIGSQSYLEVTVKNLLGELEKHYLFFQNGIVNIIKPASIKANTSKAIIPQYISIVFSSLKSEIVK